MIHLGFCEVTPDQSKITQWKVIPVDTGAAQSTLQEIKVPEYGGCYTYKNGSSKTENRYIFWRVCHDILELWEESLNINLEKNYLQLRFTDTPILEGLSIHETKKHVIILLATISSAHCIYFPHPTSKNKNCSDLSIFADCSIHSIREHSRFYLLNSHASGEGIPHTAATHLSHDTEKYSFLLCQSQGSFLVVQMNSLPHSVITHVIKTSSLINRLFTGFVPNVFRGVEGSESVHSIVMESFKQDTIAFGICVDARIRAWSLTRLECIMNFNPLQNTIDGSKSLTHGVQRHLIRSYSDEKVTYIAVFLNFTQKQLILLLKPVIEGEQLSMKLLKTYYPPTTYDLIDITITSSYIWSLWSDSNNEIKLMYSSVNLDGNEPPGFNSVYLEPLPDKDIIDCDSTEDPSESYMKMLTSPYHFSALTLQKALSIYKRSQNTSTASDREQIANEIESRLMEEVEKHLINDMEVDNVADIRADAWSSFYNHALQYHQVGRKAVSIVGVGGDGLIAIVRKQVVSWIRPMDALELLLYCQNGHILSSSLAALSSTPIFNEDLSMAPSIVALAQPLKILKESLDPEVVSAFEQDLHHLEPPDQVAESIASSLFMGEGIDLEEQITEVIASHLSSVSIVSAIQCYLRALQLDLGNPSALNIPEVFSQTSCEAYSSRLGAGILAAVVHQLAQQRLYLCRDLLLLEQILMRMDLLSSDDWNKIHSNLVSQTTILTQAYFALLKVSEASAVSPLANNAETVRRQIAVLGLNNSNPHTTIDQFPATALELFITSVGGNYARAIAKNQLWDYLLMPMATTIAQLSWPISKCLILPEFLVWEGQHSIVQEYIRLLHNWCEWNSCSRKFFFGVSLLNDGEARKAQTTLLSACEGVDSEEYLGFRIAGGQDTLEEAQIQYCLKVVRLLEQNGHPALALEMSKAAIALAPQGHPSIASVYAVAFKYHLELEHHDEAFTSLMACPDEYRRRNCLRQFIVTLYDRRCLTSLVHYNYGSLETEVINILENRARSADILATNYYDLLFAFHVNKQNYKKAAWVMYECAIRLNVEGLGEAGLKQQAKCYLASLNCLRHIPKDQAWVMKPVSRSEESVNEDPDESMASELKKLLLRKKKPQVEVFEMNDVEKEYELVHARLKLFKFTSSLTQIPGGPMNSSDTISLLAHSKLFKDALRLCYLFNHPVDTIFEHLSSACVLADRNKNPEAEWAWLSENSVHRDKSENGAWWCLLRDMLSCESKSKQSYLYRIACTNILRKGHSLPAWLADSYMKRNCGELIKLYLEEGFLEESTRLANSYIDALLGHGTEQMGLENSLQAGSPAVFMPYNTLDHLSLELKDAQQHPHFKQLYPSFNEKISQYIMNLKIVSKGQML